MGFAENEVNCLPPHSPRSPPTRTHTHARIGSDRSPSSVPAARAHDSLGPAGLTERAATEHTPPTLRCQKSQVRVVTPQPPPRHGDPLLHAHSPRASGAGWKSSARRPSTPVCPRSRPTRTRTHPRIGSDRSPSSGGNLIQRSASTGRPSRGGGRGVNPSIRKSVNRSITYRK